MNYIEKSALTEIVTKVTENEKILKEYLNIFATNSRINDIKNELEL